MHNMRRTYKNKNYVQKRNILLSFFCLLILFLILAFTFAYLSLYGLSHWKLLEVEEVKIEGTQYLNKNLLYLRLASFEGQNLFKINDNIIREILSEYKRIKSIKVIRKLPNTLKIIIQERIPIAHLSSNNESQYMIDKEGVVLDPNSILDINDYSIEHLPIFRRINTNNLTSGRVASCKTIKILLDIYNYISNINPDFLKKISEFYIQDNEVILIENERCVKFLLGSEEFPERIDKLIFAYQNFGFANYSEIDLRFSDPKNEIIILR